MLRHLCMVHLTELLFDLEAQLLAVGALDTQHALLDAPVGVDDELELLEREGQRGSSVDGTERWAAALGWRGQRSARRLGRQS